MRSSQPIAASSSDSVICARLLSPEPAYIVAQHCSPATAFADRSSAALASFVLFRKIGPTGLDWPVNLSDIVQTAYPQGETEL